MPCFKQPLPPFTEPGFDQALCDALTQLTPAEIMLERALSLGNAVDYPSVRWTLITKPDNPQAAIRVGVFFNSLIAGCSCAGDPSPADLISEFSEAMVTLEANRMDCRIDFC